MPTMELIFDVEDMMCGHCEGTVREAVETIDGIATVESVSAEDGLLHVTITEDANVEGVKEAVESVTAAKGYPAKLSSRFLTFEVDGMMCGHCEGTTREAVEALDVVDQVVSVSSDSGLLIVARASSSTVSETISAVKSAITGVGYEVIGVVGVEEGEGGEGAGEKSDDEGEGVAGDAAGATSERIDDDVVLSPSQVHGASPRGEFVDEEAGFVLDDLAHVRFLIDGMHCSNCAASVEHAMLKVPGVTEASVSVMTSEAIVSYRKSGASVGDVDEGEEHIVAAVEKAGYGATVIRRGDGAGDGDDDDGEDEIVSAAELEERARRAYQAALFDVWTSLPLALGMMFVTMVVPQMSEQAMMAIMGPMSGKHSPSAATVIEFFVACVLQFWHGQRFYQRAYRSIVAPGARLGMDALIATGTTTAFVYSVIAAIVAMVEGVPAPPLHFGAASSVIAFVLLGDYIKALAKGKATSALNEILNLQPPIADVVRKIDDTESTAPLSLPREVSEKVGGETGVVEQVRAATVAVGSVVRILPGARVPADCTILWGSGAADESMLTGESVPVTKHAGDPLLAGTTVSGSTFYAETTREGNRSAVAQIAKLVRAAQNTKSPVEDVVDRVAGVFTPVVLCLGLFTFLMWLLVALLVHNPDSYYPHGVNGYVFAITAAVDVLVVACPCAMGLATPTAIMAGMGLASRHGLIVKSAEALQSGASVSAVVFDKTGTLTTGDFALRYCEAVIPQRDAGAEEAHNNAVRALRAAISTSHGDAEGGGAGKSEGGGEGGDGGALSIGDLVLWAAASVEAISEHPIASAIVAAATGDAKNGIVRACPPLRAPDHGETVPGKGVRATLGGVQVVVGTVELVEGAKDDDEDGAGASEGGGEGSAEEVGEEVVWKKAYVPVKVREALDRQRELGATAVVLAVDGVVLGVLAVADEPREESVAAVQALYAQGVDVWMLTGDAERVAQVVARRIGIPSDHVMAQVRPGNKAKQIALLQQTLKHDAINSSKNNFIASIAAQVGMEALWYQTGVAMVGDGVNDAPALATADVGIAVGAGAAAASATADIVLAKSSPFDVVVALDVARVTTYKVLQNLLWAFGYNVLAIPIAGGLLYPGLKFLLPPIAAALLMTASSVSVVLSSLLLNSHKPPTRDQSIQEGATGVPGTMASMAEHAHSDSTKLYEPITPHSTKTHSTAKESTAIFTTVCDECTCGCENCGSCGRDEESKCCDNCHCSDRHHHHLSHPGCEM